MENAASPSLALSRGVCVPIPKPFLFLPESDPGGSPLKVDISDNLPISARKKDNQCSKEKMLCLQIRAAAKPSVKGGEG